MEKELFKLMRDFGVSEKSIPVPETFFTKEELDNISEDFKCYAYSYDMENHEVLEDDYLYIDKFKTTKKKTTTIRDTDNYTIVAL